MRPSFSSSIRSEDIGLRRGQAAQLEGQAQDPLSHGRVGEDAVGDVRGLVAHSARAAARAQASLFTRKRDEDVVAAAASVASDEASREVSAPEVALEGGRYVARQRRGVGGFGVHDEGCVMLADEAMEDGVLGPAGNLFCRRSGGRA